MKISQLFVYPIKSLNGISLSTTKVDNRGFSLDRRWVLVDETNRFISLRTHKKLAEISIRFKGESILLEHQQNRISFGVDDYLDHKEIIKIWEDEVHANLVSHDLNTWFSDVLNEPIRLFYQSPESTRFIDERYQLNPTDETSLADGYPILLISEESISHLNAKLLEPITVDRFRPNIVFKGAEPHSEDQLTSISIGSVKLGAVKKCARCNMINLNPEKSSFEKEPTKTLAGYRKHNNKIYFGMNALVIKQGAISVGDKIIQ